MLLILAVNIFIALQGLWPGPKDGLANTVVRSDVKGYYGYLQALFLRNDLGHEPPQWEYVHTTPTGTLNKYYCGTAVMMAPWFAIGHDIALGDPKAPRDGLSVHEMRALSIGAWFYLLIGLLAMRALLQRLGLRDGVIVWSLIAVGMGTQLLQYSALQPGWSHVYSFCCIALFLLVVKKLADGAKLHWSLIASALLALIILIRPVNALVLLAVPVVCGDAFLPLLKRCAARRLVLVLAFIIAAGVLFIQPMLWHIQTGRWYAYGYAGEGFHWKRPEVLKVLFGFRRGLFLWAPVLLLSLAGTAWLLWKQRARGWWMLVYWTVNVYVISAWWIWYYGSGFGSRVFVDHYPVLALPMALLLNDIGARWFLVARAFIVACCALLLFQMWQYHVFILHHESMDSAKYMHTFLRWDDSHRGELAGNYQTPPFNPHGMDVILEESCDFEHQCAHWSGSVQRTRLAYGGSHACVINNHVEFALGFSATAEQLVTDRALYLEVGLQRMEPKPGSSRSLLAVTDVVRPDGSHAYYEPFHINPVPAKLGTWEQIEYRIPVPALSPGDKLSFYFWNQDRTALAYIDDVYMRVSAVREP